MQAKKSWFLAGLSFLIGAVTTALTMQCSAWFIGVITAWIWITVEKTPPANTVKRGALAGILGAAHIVFVPILFIYSHGFNWQNTIPAIITVLAILVINFLLGAATGYFIKKRMERPPSKEETQTLSHSRWGIFSFLVALIMLVPTYLIITSTLPGEANDGREFFILLYCILPLGYLLGVGLAFTGFRETNRKRSFAVWGLIINVIASMPLQLMWVLMLMAGQPFVCLSNLASCLKQYAGTAFFCKYRAQKRQPNNASSGCFAALTLGRNSNGREKRCRIRFLN